jgi:hypothetical protein
LEFCILLIVPAKSWFCGKFQLLKHCSCLKNCRQQTGCCWMRSCSSNALHFIWEVLISNLSQDMSWWRFLYVLPG